MVMFINFAAVPTERSVDFPVKGHYLFDEINMVQMEFKIISTVIKTLD